MTEDNYNLGDVHPDLDGIISDAEKTIYDESLLKIKEDFLQIEEGIWKESGNPDGNATVWLVTVGASNIGEAKKKIAELSNDPSVIQVQLNEIPDGVADDEGGMLAMLPAGTDGDVYELLQDPSVMLGIIESDAVGLIARVGGWASTEEGVKPSESATRRELVITCLVTNGAMYTITRMLDNDDVICDILKHGDVEFGEQRLYDAMTMTFCLPSMLDGDLRTALASDLRRRIESQTE